MDRYNYKYMYLYVTQDEYEFPLDFDLSATRLARRHGVSPEAVRTGAWHAANEGRKSQWRRVRL